MCSSSRPSTDRSTRRPTERTCLPTLSAKKNPRRALPALSGSLPEAFEDYSKAIELNPSFAEAYYNRGIIQIFMKDTRKGCLDISKAGELGITEAYEVLKRYAQIEN